MEILLVDDDASDRELFVDAIKLAGKDFKVTEAENGEKALQYLQSSSSLPHLIILDLNMPVKDGRATLKELKEHRLFKRIPVCIMTTSSAPFDISNAYENGANLFLVKPMDFKLLIEMLSSLLTLLDKYVAFPNLSV
ncbi:MAG TPA: response regulator [Flavisolibacter sp.]|jgi:CheY-like chemotaxis protein|nr:response regulator [Flavisolibacter sp.]